jgi:hypothetical protein
MFVDVTAGIGFDDDRFHVLITLYIFKHFPAIVSIMNNQFTTFYQLNLWSAPTL